MSENAGLKALFLEAPDGHIDASIMPTIEEWCEPPTALQLLKTLDMMVHHGAASGFVVSAIDMMMRDALVSEGLAYEQIVAKAYWRGD